MSPDELEAIRERATAALDSTQSATDDRAALLAELDRLNTEFTDLIRDKRTDIAALHPAFAWGNLSVGTEDIERILGRRLP